ncbi:MAG: hypothetical protein ACJZ16_03290 [Methylophilaceae bacterium]|jgi:hypothetical protein|tara:strand:- start:299 stop:433 length:135 start_codon:yes stop_codon:yes gene_type:complete
MNKQDFTKIEELLEKIYKTLIYVFLIVGFFAFLYFGLLIYLFLQ